MAYTVKQVASLSGVSVRTLHFYDELGLLKPASVTANGYRHYGEAQLLTLQQILFYRELGFRAQGDQEHPGQGGFRKGGRAEIAPFRTGEESRPNADPDRDHR